MSATDGWEREEHPSFGMVGISHASSNGTVLVGSEFMHHHFVTLKISRATKMRSLSREWWFARERVIEIHLSEAQLVELIGRPNTGDGVACTLDWIKGEQIPPPPEPITEKEKFRADMKADAKRCVRELEEAHAELVAAIESGKVGKTVLKAIADKIKHAGCAVSSGIPLVAEQFEESMERTVKHAAVEIEATVASLAMRLGIEQMRGLATTAPKLLEEPQEQA